MFEVSHIPTERYVAIMKGLWRVVFFVLVKIPAFLLLISLISWVTGFFPWFDKLSSSYDELSSGGRVMALGIGMIICLFLNYTIKKLEKKFCNKAD